MHSVGDSGGQLEDHRVQFLRSRVWSKISEVDFSDTSFVTDGRSEFEIKSSASASSSAASSSSAADSDDDKLLHGQLMITPKAARKFHSPTENEKLPSLPTLKQQEQALAPSQETDDEGAKEGWEQQSKEEEEEDRLREISLEAQMEAMNNEIANARVSMPSNADVTNYSPTPSNTSLLARLLRDADEMLSNPREYFIHDHIKWRMWYKKKVQPFRKIIIAQICCALYILIATFAKPPVGMKDPDTGDIIDPTSEENTANGVILVNGSYRPVVAIGGWQKFCLAMSRMSAFSMYPVIVVAFFSKMKAMQTFLSKTPLSMYFAMITEGHDYHVYAGRYIAFDIWIHTVFHILRWLSQGNMELLGTTLAGQTGLIAIVVTPLITYPMMYFKRRGCALLRPYEIRKALHYLFFVFAIALCWHVPSSAIPNGGFLWYVLTGCISLYALDSLYVHLFMCEKIETTSFCVLSSGVRISMPVSERFQRQAFLVRNGFAYINLPWINDKQWHPFSLFEDPSDTSIQEMFLMKNGDWTKEVHRALARDTMRPVWIKGPFPSPFSHAGEYDNQILVASGIGITPALGAINAFKHKRRVNLIWALRDPEMLEFFMGKMYLEHDGWNLIFYTGKKPLNPDIYNLNTNVKVISGRPKLDSVIPNIIYGIESGEGMPENYTRSAKDKRLTDLITDIDKDQSMSTVKKVLNIRQKGKQLGLSFSLAEDLESQTAASEDGAKVALRDLRSSLKVALRELRNEHTAEESHLDVRFHPWEQNESQEKCVERLDDSVMSTWGLMYCGGSPPVVKSLQQISLKYRIDCHVDSFAW